MIFYCPSCWAEIAESATVCRHCHTDLSQRISQADYVDKLIVALRHKEPMTPVRAAWVLGERHEERAVPALAKIVKKTQDASLVESAVEALGKIGGDVASAAVRGATQHSSLRVRVKAREVLQRIEAQKLSQTSSSASAAQRIPVRRMFSNEGVLARRMAQRNSSLFLRRQLPPRTTRPIPARGGARVPAAYCL
jgi:HEAT repeat protein